MKSRKSGEIDTTFGSGGTVEVAFPGEGPDVAKVARGYQITTSPDGQKIYASFHINPPRGPEPQNAFYGARCLDGNGGTDEGFGQHKGDVWGAYVRGVDDFVGEKDAHFSLAREVVLLPDGTLLVCGDATGIYSGDSRAGIAKYSEDGRRDPTFGKNGIWSEAFPEWPSFTRTRVIPQSDGGLFVVGSVAREGSASAIGLVRLTSTGSLDTGFNATGWRVVPFPEATESTGLRDAAAAPDGKIIVSGQGLDAGIVMRLNADGNADISFGDNGTGIKRVVFSGESGDWPVTIDKLLVKPDGSVIAIGGAIEGSIYRGLIAALDAGGNNDVAFNGGNIVLSSYTLAYARFYDAAIDTSGSIVVTGHIKRNSDFRFIIARYLPSGTPDVGFGPEGDGSVQGDEPEDEYAEPSIALQDGRVLVFSNMGRWTPPAIPYRFFIKAFVA